MKTSALIHSDSARATKKLGALLSRYLKPGDIVLFLAQLGAGKTTLIQGLIRQCGIQEDALSPTFVVAQTFHGKKVVHHLDFYRLSPNEIIAMGIQDYLLGQGEIERGLVLIEWANRCKEIWPKHRLEIRIQAGRNPSARRITLTGHGAHFCDVIKKVKGSYAR